MVASKNEFSPCNFMSGEDRIDDEKAKEIQVDDIDDVIGEVLN